MEFRVRCRWLVRGLFYKEVGRGGRAGMKIKAHLKCIYLEAIVGVAIFQSCNFILEVLKVYQ